MPLLWLSLAFLIGIWLGELTGIALAAWTVIFSFLVGLWIAAFWLKRVRLFAPPASWLANRHPALFVSPISLPVLLCLGGLAYQLWLPAVTPQHIAYYNDQRAYRIRGSLSLPPDRREKVVLLRIQADSIRSNEPGAPTIKINGSLQAMLAASTPALRYGDRVELTGRLATPPEEEEFSYRAYLARQGVYSYMEYPYLVHLGENTGNPVLAAIYTLQESFYQVVQRQFAPPESELLAGILLGIEQGIPPDLMEDFRSTGTAHIIAISGFNITILVVFISALFLRVVRRRWVAVLLCLLTVAIYTLLVGAAPSVVRAAIMGGLAVIASELGRRSASLNALALTAALMCLFSPGLLQDVSFQLSTAATLGLVLFSAPLQAAFSRQVTARLPAGAAKHATRLVSDYLLTTLAAQITTLPVIAFHFQRFSLSALLANPLILPPQPLVMMVGGLSVLAGSLLPPLGQALAWLAQPFAAYTIHMVELLAQIPGGEIYLNPASPLWLAAYYGIILLIAFQHKLAGKVGGWVRQLITPSLMVIAAVGLTATAWQAVLKQPDGRLHLTVLNVPDGPALLLQTPGGRALLINSGSSARILLDQLGRRLPTPGPGLDWIWGTDRRAAALAAFEGVLPRYPARQAALNLLPASTRTRERLVETLQKRGTALHTLEAKMRLDLGDGANLEVVTASKQGAALLVEYGSFRALIPGGMAPPGLADLPPPARQDLSLLVLGSADSEFLSDPIWANLAPQLVVLCSVQPGYGSDLSTLHLKPGGWLHIRSDGTKMELEEK